MDFEFWDNCWGRPTQPFHLTQPHHFLIKYFSSFFAGQERVFLPLCGKTQDLNFLAKHGIQGIGVEFNPSAVESFFEDSQLTPSITQHSDKTLYQADYIELWLADFFKLSTRELGRFTGVFDRAALIALPDDLRSAYADHLKGFVSPDGVLLMVTMDYDIDEMSGPPFYVTKAELEHLFKDAQITELERFDILDSHPRWRELELSRLHEVLYKIQFN